MMSNFPLTREETKRLLDTPKYGQPYWGLVFTPWQLAWLDQVAPELAADIRKKANQ